MRRVKKAVQEGRLIRTTAHFVDRVAALPVRQRLAIRWGHPTLADMLEISSGRLTLNADAFVDEFAANSDYRSEFDTLVSELKSRRSQDGFPQIFDVGIETARALYSHTRAHQPSHILETGVANGVSTYFFLHALNRNGSGTLHSIDTSASAGGLLTVEERHSWDFQILERNYRRSLSQIIDSLPPLDLFVHDSDHSYPWMRHEYATVYPKMNPGAWVTSDDVDASYAYAEFCRDHAISPIYLLDGKKYFGIARVKLDA